MSKLETYGFRGVTNEWFRSYLTGRTQFVCIDKKNSENEKIVFGVPQGSVLGPILFLLYINDLRNAILHSRVYSFADDTALFYTNKKIKHIRKKLNKDLKSLLTWLRANKIALNASKTEIILFKSPKRKVNNTMKIKLGKFKLKFTSHVKYLGITLDEKLSWGNYLEQLAKKL